MELYNTSTMSKDDFEGATVAHAEQPDAGPLDALPGTGDVPRAVTSAKPWQDTDILAEETRADNTSANHAAQLEPAVDVIYRRDNVVHKGDIAGAGAMTPPANDNRQDEEFKPRPEEENASALTGARPKDDNAWWQKKTELVCNSNGESAPSSNDIDPSLTAVNHEEKVSKDKPRLEQAAFSEGERADHTGFRKPVYVKLIEQLVLNDNNFQYTPAHVNKLTNAAFDAFNGCGLGDSAPFMSQTILPLLQRVIESPPNNMLDNLRALLPELVTMVQGNSPPFMSQHILPLLQRVIESTPNNRVDNLRAWFTELPTLVQGIHVCYVCKKLALGIYYRCETCQRPAYTMCKSCHDSDIQHVHEMEIEPAEICDNCKQRAPRTYYTCNTCPGYVLCENCFHGNIHTKHEMEICGRSIVKCCQCKEVMEDLYVCQTCEGYNLCRKCHDNGLVHVHQMSHPFPVCACCKEAVLAISYKCQICPDYRICRECHDKNTHTGHEIVRVLPGTLEQPEDQWDFDSLCTTIVSGMEWKMMGNMSCAEFIENYVATCVSLFRLKDESDPTYLYHYSTAAAKIVISGIICPSLLKDHTKFGKGVYFTELSPEQESAEVIRTNNYDGNIDFDASNVMFAVQVPLDSVKGVKRQKDKKRPWRNIWLLETEEPFQLPPSAKVVQSQSAKVVHSPLLQLALVLQDVMTKYCPQPSMAEMEKTWDLD